MGESPASERRTIDDLLRDARARLDRLGPGARGRSARRSDRGHSIGGTARRAGPRAGRVVRAAQRARVARRSRMRASRSSLSVTGPLVLMCAQGFPVEPGGGDAAGDGDPPGNRRDRRLRGLAGRGCRCSGTPRGDLRHRATRWDRVFEERGPAGVSWFEQAPGMSLKMIDLAGLGPHEAVWMSAGRIAPGGRASRARLRRRDRAGPLGGRPAGRARNSARWPPGRLDPRRRSRLDPPPDLRALARPSVLPLPGRGRQERYLATARSALRFGGTW